MKFEFLYATKIINLYVIYKKLKLKKKYIFIVCFRIHYFNCITVDVHTHCLSLLLLFNLYYITLPFILFNL